MRTVFFSWFTEKVSWIVDKAQVISKRMTCKEDDLRYLQKETDGKKIQWLFCFTQLQGQKRLSGEQESSDKPQRS